jgi:EAL domain-containing protein (putative c-di-GMP-specific phosphodiesterase class I)
VNLSGKELMQTDVVERVQTLLDAAGVKPSAIKLEITESLLMENPEAVAERLAALRSLGVLLGIDDFGTGYSSLSYLHRFPVNTLKIDRSFVSRIGPRSEDSEIIRTVVALAHNLGLDTVAEGIETTEQLVHLQALGCEYGQGFLFAKPLHRDDTERLIAANPVWDPTGVFASKAS